MDNGLTTTDVDQYQRNGYLFSLGVLEYIDVFFNRNSRHGYFGHINPVEFKQKTSGLYETVH
jgi:hypothetical protein